jgi:hypothetical protein
MCERESECVCVCLCVAHAQPRTIGVCLSVSVSVCQFAGVCLCLCPCLSVQCALSVSLSVAAHQQYAALKRIVHHCQSDPLAAAGHGQVAGPARENLIRVIRVITYRTYRHPTIHYPRRLTSHMTIVTIDGRGRSHIAPRVQGEGEGDGHGEGESESESEEGVKVITLISPNKDHQLTRGRPRGGIPFNQHARPHAAPLTGSGRRRMAAEREQHTAIAFRQLAAESAGLSVFGGRRRKFWRETCLKNLGGSFAVQFEGDFREERAHAPVLA